MKPSEIDVLYRRYGHIVLRRAHAILRNRADAEELTQELFASMLQREVELEAGTSMVTYLYRATTNRALNHLRDAKNRRRLLDTTQREQEPVGDAPDVRAMALQTLGSLPEELAAVAVYAFIDEMTHDEISKLIGCSRRQVGNLVERITRRVGEVELVS